MGTGEIDILARRGERTFVVEVRTRWGGEGDPLESIDGAKRRQVGALARRVGAEVGLLGLRFDRVGVDLHWCLA